MPWSEYAILVGLGIVPALLGRRITLPWMISALSVYWVAESADLYNSIISHWKNIDCDNRYLNGIDFEGDGMTLFIFYIMMAATFYLSLILDALAVIVQSILSRIRS